MNAKPNHQMRKFLYGILLAGMLLLLCLGMSGSPAVHAQEVETPEPNSEYFTVIKTTLDDGRSVDETIINGPPNPPDGYELERAAVDLPEPSDQMAIHALTVPAYDWVFGCSAVSGAMIAGYYDRNGFPNMYIGPANGGVMPLDNSTTYWLTWSDGYTTYPNLPLAASHQGVDGRTTRGSIDDYWVQYESPALDPYLTGLWTPHIWGDAIGDYMKTSQSAFGNTDGSTHFYTLTESATQLTCANMVSGGVSERDGTYGRKLFYEARGYTVTDCYNQKTDNVIAGGFSLAQFKAEIDAGRPVMLNLAGHTVVGVGYDDLTNTVYIHDTWDYNDHTMTWGGTYLGMALQSVSIVNIQSSIPSYRIYLPLVLRDFASLPPGDFNKSAPANGATSQPTNPTLSWGASSNATSYEYCIDTNNNSACDATWTSTAVSTSVGLSGLTPATSYYWQAHAKNALGTTNADGGTWWSFTIAGSPTPTGPTAGFWESDTDDEFYVTHDQANVDNFAIYIDVTGCGSYKITHLTAEPIVGNQFSFTGPFYASGTFDSTTSAHGTDGLISYDLPNCGPVSGSWSWTATWKNSSQPAAAVTGGDAQSVILEPALQMPPYDHTITIER